MIWNALAIVRRADLPSLKLVALGVIATIGLQAVINMIVVTGLGPTKGIALPLLSSGGTGWILTGAMLGVLVAIDRTAPDESAQPLPGVEAEIAIRARMPQPVVVQEADEPLELEPEREPELAPQVVVKPRVRLPLSKA